MESVIAYIVGILVFVLGLSFSIGLHELGHLLPAKKFNVKVTQYMIGFGPTIWSRTKGDTEYGVKAIPFGGYIRMIGMYLPRKGEPEGTVHNDSTGFTQQLSRGTETMTGEVISDHDKARTFVGLPWYRKIVIMLGGPVMNLLLAFVFTAVALVGIGTSTVTDSNTIGSVSRCVVNESDGASTTMGCTSDSKPAPALAAGVKPGDTIVAVNGVKIATFADIVSAVAPLAGKTIPLVVVRDGKTLALTITPESFIRNQGTVDKPQLKTVGFLGVGADFAYQTTPVSQIPGVLWNQFSGTAHMILNLPERMVTVVKTTFGGGERAADGPIGIVGVARFSGEIAQTEEPGFDTKSKLSTMFQVLGSLNMALFVFNLVPLLPLDGGHVFAALIDGLRGAIARLRRKAAPRPFDITRLMPLTLVVFFLIAGMSVMLVIADIFNPVKFFG